MKIIIEQKPTHYEQNNNSDVWLVFIKPFSLIH